MNNEIQNVQNLMNWLDPIAANKDIKFIKFTHYWRGLPMREVMCYLIRFGYSISRCEQEFDRGSKITRAYTRFWQCFRYSDLPWAQKKFDKLGFKETVKIINRNRLKAGMSALEYKY